MLRAHTLAENAIYLLLWNAFEDRLLNQSCGVDELSALSKNPSPFCKAVNEVSAQTAMREDIERAQDISQETWVW
jgi:hypothetical protein